MVRKSVVRKLLEADIVMEERDSFLEFNDADGEQEAEDDETIRVKEKDSWLLDEAMIEQLGRSLLAGEGSGSNPPNDPGSEAYQREIEALEKWLEDGADPVFSPQDEDSFNEAWKVDIAADGKSEGFEDDFTPFVSSPPSSDATTSTSLNSSTSTITTSSTGSGSGSDPSLPTPSEILQTSRRIFGPSYPQDPSTISPTSTAESRQLDLTSIFDSLQNMKEEIALIEDEDERRKAAARVALGVVWGLEGREKVRRRNLMGWKGVGS